MKKLLIGLGIVLLVFFGWNYFNSNYFGERSDGGSNNFSSVIINKSEMATTSPTYFTAGTTASSTKIINSELYGKLALNVCLNASTTASSFRWTIEQADNTTVAETTWFNKLDYAETSSTLRTWGANIVYNIWTPGYAGVTCAQLLDVDDFVGVRTRITYNVVGANGSVFLETFIK